MTGPRTARSPWPPTARSPTRPTANYHGTDTFTYRTYDGTATSAAATVTITVAEGDDVPAAAADAYSTNEDHVLTVTADDGVLANDTGSGVHAVLVANPATRHARAGHRRLLHLHARGELPRHGHLHVLRAPTARSIPPRPRSRSRSPRATTPRSPKRTPTASPRTTRCRSTRHPACWPTTATSTATCSTPSS